MLYIVANKYDFFITINLQNSLYIGFLFQLKAYPEYLVTYQIVKPEDSSSGNEDSSRWCSSNTTLDANSRRNCNNKIDYFIITPAVPIDQSYIDDKRSALCIVNKLCEDTQNTTHIHRSDVDRDNRREIMRTFSKSSVSRHWCTLLDSAVECCGIRFGFTASATFAVINTNCCTQKNHKTCIFCRLLSSKLKNSYYWGIKMLYDTTRGNFEKFYRLKIEEP